MRRVLLAAGGALAFGSAVFGTVALIHVSNVYYADLDVTDTLANIDRSFVTKMQDICGGENASWRRARYGKGYECLDIHGRITRRLKESTK